MRTYLTSCLEKVKAEYMEIRYEETRIARVHYVGKELESIGESEARGGGIRAQGKDGWSFVSFNNLDKLSSYLRISAKEACLARGSEVKLAPILPRVEVIRTRVKVDPRRIPLEEKYHLCSRYNQVLLSFKKVQTSNLRYADIHTVKYFANSEGTYIEQERVDTILGMTAIAREGDNIQFAHEGVGGTGGYELVEGLETKAEEVGQRAVSLLNAEPLSGGKYRVIVDPKLSGVFAHEAFGHLSEADFLYENDRFKRIMRLGRVFGPPELNIIDEAPIEGKSGYYLYDDEGVPGQKTYLIKGGRIGFSSVNNLKDPHPLVNRALSSSQFGQRTHFHLPAPSGVSPVRCLDAKISSLRAEKMVEEGQRAIDLITRGAPQFSCEGELEKLELEVRILNSRGLDESYKKTEYAFFLYAFLAREGDFLGIEEGEGGCSYKDSSSSIAERIIRATDLARNKVKISVGSYPAIFTSKAMPLLLRSIRSGINGKLVQKRSSPLTEKVGTSIVCSSVNIVDDGLFPFGSGSRPLDGEGMPSRRTQIIKDGILKGFIYDLQTASLMKTESTANAARSYDSLPTPSTTNFILKPGNVSFEEMVGDIKEGIIVDQVIGSGQGNELTGEFSVNLDLGYKVEGGKIKGRVKDVMISGNAYNLLNKVVAIGRKARFVGTVRTPPLYFERVNVAG